MRQDMPIDLPDLEAVRTQTIQEFRQILVGHGLLFGAESDVASKSLGMEE